MKKLTFNSEPYIIENKNYSSIEFIIIFPFKYDKKYIGYNKLIQQLVMNTSYEYNNEQDYQKAYGKKMIINQGAYAYSYNNNSFFEFNLVVPDPKKVKIFDIEPAFKFFVDTIYRPNVENNAFNKYYFEREKTFIKEKYKNKEKDIYYYSNQKFLKKVDNAGILVDELYNNIEELDKISPEDLFNYYKKNILDNTPILVVYGDVDKNIKDLFYKYLKIEEKNITFVKDYYNFLEPYNKIKNIEEQTNYYQSILFLGYKIKSMSKKDIIYLKFLNDLIHCNQLLFNDLRLKENLVYSISTEIRSGVGLFVVKTYINSKEKEKTIKAIKESLDKLLSENIFEEFKNKMIENLKCHQIRNLDDITTKLSNFMINKFEFSYTLEELIEEYKNINLTVFSEFYQRLTLDIIYFLRGEFDGK